MSRQESATTPATAPRMTHVLTIESEPPATPQVGEYVDPETNPIPTSLPSTVPQLTRFQAFARRWAALRWHLDRALFSRTLVGKLKVGEALFVAPVALGLVVWAAIACYNHQVKGSGTPPALAMLLTFFFTIRNNSALLSLTGLPYERAIRYHKLFGVIAAVTSGIHGLAYQLAKDDKSISLAFKFRAGVSQEFSGTAAASTIVAVLVFSFGPIRRHFYHLFVRFHWLLFIAAAVLCIIHGAGLVVIGFVSWLLDVFFRYRVTSQRYRSEKGVIHSSRVTVTRVTQELIRIQFPRTRDETTFYYEAGQYVFLCVPTLGHFEWHPFTIASAPWEDTVTIYVKVLGDWTKRLAEAAPTSPGTSIEILVEGPYGSVGIEMSESSPYSHLAFFSGGVGITPMMALANQVHYDALQSKIRHHPLEKALFVWAGRERDLLEALLPGTDIKGQGSTSRPWFPLGATCQPHHSDVFTADLYLTKGSPEPSHAVDLRFGGNLKYGRPNVAQTLLEIGQQAKEAKKTRVGVMVCGPVSLTRQVTVESAKVARQLGISFDVHWERFKF